VTEPTDEQVEQLRDYSDSPAGKPGGYVEGLLDRVADCIEAQAARIAELEAALKLINSAAHARLISDIECMSAIIERTFCNIAETAALAIQGGTHDAG
jgi:hypothetical protein